MKGFASQPKKPHTRVESRVDSAYAQNYARLQQLKQRFDPDNLFRMNPNIAPAALARTA